MADRVRYWPAALAALAALSLLTGLPAVPGHVLAAAHRGLVLELPLLLALLALLHVRPGPRIVWAVALGCWLVLLLRLADMAALMTAGRRFEPAFDPALIPALWEVAATGPGTVMLGLGLLAGTGGLLLLCRWLSGLLLRPLQENRGRAGTLVLGIACLLAAMAGPGWLLQPPDRGPAGAIIEQADRWREAARMQARMAADLAQDPSSGIADADLFALLRGRPVILAWVESYGLSALTDPRQADIVGARLAALDGMLTDAGFHRRSGLVDSPVIGGRSWLAHGTLRAGIRQDQPLAQRLVLDAGRCGLSCALNRAGWRTLAAMPGLSMPWLEGPAWGFEQVMDRAAFPYAGPAFGWSPLPDQALLATLTPERLLPAAGPAAGPAAEDERPLYLEIVLTSSHAPWTPLPPWLDGSDGAADGTAFSHADLRPDYTDMAGGYARSLDYSLRALGDWLVGQAPPGALILILGDHPALDWISAGQGHRVPLHILSRDADLLRRLDGLDLADGMVPSPTAAALPMWDIYPQLLSRFSTQPLQRRTIHADMRGQPGRGMP
ncbi:hypothetical protein [Niveispirillum fermenti]|uniref:hypothetical protein n=1 Tax=Niveispirillum fermenti TaxID=1233113 RepID=UPI003A86FEF4